MLREWLARLPGGPVRIDPDLWDRRFAALPFLHALDAGQRERLQGLCGQLLADKSMSGAGGLTLTADMQVHIAMQACLPILDLGLAWYRGWSGIIVYPDEFRVERRVHDELGVVHEFEETLAGESWDGGPLLLSWADAGAPHAGAQAANVVIHEFAHKIDQLSGEADGMPPFDRRLHVGLDRRHWRATLEDAHERLCAALELIEAGLPADVDPESAAADPYYAALPLDPYAATDTAEFFAVSSETFFLDAARLRDAFPAWHALLARFYRPPPAA